MLRVLVRDVKSSRNRGSAYPNHGGISGNASRFVTITSRAAPPNSDVDLHKLGDDRSDRSILGNNNNNKANNNEEEGQRPKNGIMQVTDITVKYDNDPE